MAASMDGEDEEHTAESTNGQGPGQGPVSPMGEESHGQVVSPMAEQMEESHGQVVSPMAQETLDKKEDLPVLSTLDLDLPAEVSANIAETSSKWLALGKACFTMPLVAWTSVPRLSISTLFPPLTAEVAKGLCISHLANGLECTRKVRWGAKKELLLKLLDIRYKPQSSWEELFSIEQGKVKKQRHMDEIFQGVIQMPWHHLPEPVHIEPQQPDAICKGLELSTQWETGLANSGVIPCPSYEEVLEHLHSHFKHHSGKDPVFSLYYARTSSEGKASDKSSSFKRQQHAFLTSTPPSFDGVPAIALGIVYNPKGEASFLPLANEHRPYASKLWSLLHQPSPLLEFVNNCFGPCVGHSLHGACLKYLIVETVSRFSRDVAYGIEDFRQLACGPRVRLSSIKEPFVFHYLGEPVHMKCGVLEWWPPYTMGALANVLLQAHQERSSLADRTQKGREEIIKTTSNILTPHGKSGSGQRSLCHIFAFHNKFDLKLLQCTSQWGNAMRQLVQEVNAWVPSLPLDVRLYLSSKSTVSLKSLATIRQNIHTLWMRDGSPEDMPSWLHTVLTPEMDLKSQSLVAGLSHKRHLRLQ